jgi:hypothetical protein
VLPERIGRVVIQPLEQNACRQWFEQRTAQKPRTQRRGRLSARARGR